jgi:hypothetical protein
VTTTIGHGWTPQGFGHRNAKDVRDPLIEPLWEGERVLVALRDGTVTAVDVDGANVELDGGIGGDVLDLARADDLVLDAYLTAQARRSSEGAVVGDVSAPSAAEMAGQMFVGRSRSRRSELSRSTAVTDPDAPRALVVVDLLELDTDSLLDVPLLERKRLLESVLDEAELVRLGAYVRPPVDPWIGTWRALGFHSIAYKAANGRYRPGDVNDGWAIARIPPR